MNHLKKAVVLGLCCSSASVGVMANTAQPATGTWYGQFSVGAAWSRLSQDQQFFLNPGIEKRYVANKKNSTFPVGEIFIAKKMADNTKGNFKLGVAVATTGNADVQGTIWDGASPLFKNHRYHYQVCSTRLAVKGKFAFAKQFIVSPFVSASVGVALNKAHAFTNTPLIPAAVANPNFNDHTTTSFAYTLAVGILKNISDNVEAGVRYEFADSGKSALARAPGQTLNSGLNLSHLRTNGVLFHIGFRAA